MTRTSLALAILAAGAFATPVLAQAPAAETVETLASEAEITSVNATLEMIGCTAPEVEKENADLFEVDDATCEIGQYDIKLDAEFSIISMTRD